MNLKIRKWNASLALALFSSLPLAHLPVAHAQNGSQYDDRYRELDYETPNTSPNPAPSRPRSPAPAPARPARPPAAPAPATSSSSTNQNPPRTTQNPAPVDSALAPYASAIQSLLESSSSLKIGMTPVNVENLKKVYAARAYRPFFILNKEIGTLGRSVQDMLEYESEFHGFNGKHYFTADSALRLDSTDLKALIEVELLLTNGYIELAFNMASGRVNPRDKSQNLADIELTPPPPPKLELIVAALKNVESMQQGIRDLAPHTIAYVKLLQTLVALKNAQSWGGWPALTDLTTLKPGMAHPSVWPVRVRLVDMGALDKAQRQNKSSVYDNEMMKGVMRLQKALFKAQDGVVGRATYEILTVPLESRIVQTKANLERWRLLPRELGDRFIFVDLGRQELDLMEGNKLIDRMRVVVGKDLNGTPTMIDSVRNVIVNPYWRPPKSIVVKEIIPAYLRDASYFERNNMKVLTSRGPINPEMVDWSKYTMESPPPYEFRQEPGESNSLGVLKFSLNNAHAIYMHDTNHKEAFNRSVRYLSHGCIRLQKPLALASYLLRDQGLDEEAIQEQIADPSNIAKTVKVSKPIKVYIFGTTMVAYSDGTVAFGEDIYKQDQRIVDAMNGVHSNIPSVTAPSVQLEKDTTRVTTGQ